MSVSKKTLDHGAKSYHFPTIPRAPRSAIPTRKRKFPHQIPKGCGLSAIDLLATVAGKLLEESECSSASSSAAVGFDWFEIDKVMIKNEPRDVDKEGDHDDQGSSEGSVFFSGLQKDVCIGKLETVNELSGELASPFASSVCSEKVDSDLKLITGKSNESFVYHSSKLDGGFPKCGETDDTNIKNRLLRQLDTNLGESGDTTVANKSTAPTNTEEDVELTLCRGSNPNTSFLKHGNNVKINCKDTDETISQCSQPKTMEKEFISPTSVRDFKLSTSKYWKTAPKLKDYEESDTDGIAKRTQPSQRTYNEIEKSQRPLKKRIMFNPSSVVTYDGGFSSESVTNSPEKGIIDEKNASAAKLHEEKGTPSSGFCGQKSSNSRNSNVRLNIKSFKIPEFVIEAPESTTVGSLKSTVLEAVNAMLNNGLRVGVLVHGKKIQDDNRTLLQSGISQSDDINTVGFMLEPNIPTQPSPPVGLSEPPTSLPCGSPKLAIRSQFNTVVDTQNKPSITDSNRPTESIKGFVPSLTTERTDKTVFNSKAIVPVPEDRIEALAVVPVSHRSKRADIGQRRTRRPFSVFEVEALVRAVEELGTGRWRDVKLCAFENAKHRTYVDLKDKWKTLVHTARISPQQRRGEPVPQELLDRVLSAQSYWSEHQAKQHGKQLNHHHPQGF